MSDLVEEFLIREKDGLAGLEGEIPSAFDGKAISIFSCDIDVLINFLLCNF